MINTYTYQTRSTGLDRALSGMSCTGLTKHYRFADINNIPDLTKCDIAIFGNLLPDQLAAIKHPYLCYMFCSPFGQADLSSHDFPSAEIAILYTALHMRENGDIQQIITTDFELAIVHKCLYVPPTLDIKDYTKYHNLFKKTRHGYGFLGNNLRKHRNLHNQLVAMSLLPKKPIIINNNHPTYYYAKKIYDLKFKVVSLTDEQYWEEISSHELSFQATYSESFNYMALEYALVGVPTITCLDVGVWYPEVCCIVKNVDSPTDIANTARRLIQNGYWNVSHKLHQQAVEINEQRKVTAYQALDSLNEKAGV